MVGLICAVAAGAIIISAWRSIQAGGEVPMPRLMVGLVLAAISSLAFRAAR